MNDDDSLAKELIVKAIKLGVIDLTIDTWDMNKQFVLPDEVLQSQTLARFNLWGPWDREFDKLHDYFPKLNYLSLEIKYELPRHDLWAKFACLKKLKIDYDCNDDLRIRSPSLERMSITLSGCYDVNIVEFDFPNICKLKFDGNTLPRRFELKTSTTRRDEWESEIDTFDVEYKSSDELFRRCSQFVRMLSLSRSRVSLSIYMALGTWDEFRYFGDGLAIPAVEKLRLSGYQAVKPAFLDALFGSCRPKFVEIQNRCLFGLKKVNVEEFQQLRSLPWETFYQVSSDDYGYDVRFQLN